MENGAAVESSLAWVKPYYTRAGEYWGPGADMEVPEGRRVILERHFGSEPLTVLELGAGTGESAAAVADAGHTVFAIEFSPTRAPNILELGRASRKGQLIGIEADFYEVQLPRQFDVVCYWDGFGVGSDNDQRRLLKRIASEWLKPGGTALIDVFNPSRWIREAGSEVILERNHPSHRFRQRRGFNFDPIHGLFLDQWCPIDDETGACDESMAITQRIRCYNPSDLRLLLEGTDLQIERLEVNGNPLDPDTSGISTGHPLWSAWSYLAVLRRIPRNST